MLPKKKKKVSQFPADNVDDDDALCQSSVETDLARWRTAEYTNWGCGGWAHVQSCTALPGKTAYLYLRIDLSNTFAMMRCGNNLQAQTQRWRSQACNRLLSRTQYCWRFCVGAVPIHGTLWEEVTAILFLFFSQTISSYHGNTGSMEKGLSLLGSVVEFNFFVYMKTL